MSNKRTIYIRGTANWAKILGNPVDNKNFPEQGRAWSLDLVVDKEGEKVLKDAKLNDRIKTSEKGEKFVSLKQKEFRVSNGEQIENAAPRVVDVKGDTWPTANKIGNGSKVDAKIEVWDFGPGKKHGVYLRGVRVLDHVSYETEEFPPIKEGDEYYEQAYKAEEKTALETLATEDDLDDDVPF